MTGSGATFRAVSLPVFAGLLVRAIPVMNVDFPLNDGGLFYTMTHDLQNANFLLPATTSYNGLGIPFAYPPLGFYVAGLLSSVSGIGLLDVFRFLPVVIATLMIPAVYSLARVILATRFQALLATWAFALLPRAFEWLIVGGGLTRSLGLLLAVLAIRESVVFYRTSDRRHGVATAILAGLTALTHPEAALMAGLSILLMLLAYRRTWRAFRDSVVLGALAALVAAPWWLAVIAVHGVAPFVSGGQATLDSGATFQYLATFNFTDEPYLTFLGALGLLGFLHELASRRFLLPEWVLLLFVLDPRAAATSAMVPLSLLVAVAVAEVLLARLPDPRSMVRVPFGRALLIAGLVLGIVGAVKAPIVLGSPLHSLDPADRSVMAWIAANAPPTAEFAVVTGSQWFVDADSEWFPVLTGHRSVATLQGYEWLDKETWSAQASRNVSLQICAYETARCVTDWTAAAGHPDAWIYVPALTIDARSPTRDCCAGLRASLATDPDYTVVYESAGGMVLKPRS